MKFRQPLINDNGSLTGWHYWGHLNGGFVPPVRDGEDSQQYLNLNDKNGKEIYDGDIVSFDGHLVYVEYDPATVQWSICPDMCSIELRKGLNERGRVSPVNYPEIVGNIIENPELKNKARQNVIGGLGS